MHPILVSATPCQPPAAEPSASTLAELVRAAQAALLDDLGAARTALRTALMIVRGRDVSLVRSGGLAPWQAKKLNTFIDGALHRSISVEDLAATVGLSVSYLGRAFKVSFGIPPQAFVLTRRLARARALMADNGLSLNRISTLCGFSDQAHFSRQFRRAYGVSPNRWRRRHWIESEALAA